MLNLKPPALLKIDRSGEKRIPLPIPEIEPYSKIDVDQLGRIWMFGWKGESSAIVIEGESKQRVYSSLSEALAAHRLDFQPGHIFKYDEAPFFVKSPHGVICINTMGGEEVIVITSGGIRPYSLNEVDPSGYEPSSPPNHGPGTCPSYEGEPWYDKKGNLFVGIWHRWFQLQDGKWAKADVDREKDSVLKEAKRTFNYHDKSISMKPWTGEVKQNGFNFIQKGFHFYAQTHQGLRQIDFGINPLTRYPKWSSPYGIQILIDQQGIIWMSPGENWKTWYRLKKIHFR